MHFAMTESLFLTSRRHPLNAVEATRKALRMDLKIGSTTALLKAIVQQLVNAVTQHAENLAAHMESGLPPTTLASCGERSAMCAAPPFACTASS